MSSCAIWDAFFAGYSRNVINPFFIYYSSISPSYLVSNLWKDFMYPNKLPSFTIEFIMKIRIPFYITPTFNFFIDSFVLRIFACFQGKNISSISKACKFYSFTYSTKPKDSSLFPQVVSFSKNSSPTYSL